MKHFYLLFFLLFQTGTYVSAQKLTYSQEAYQNRQDEYRQEALANFRSTAIPIQAYMKQPVDQATINDIFARITTNGEFDFNLVQLVRILFFSNGEYDSQFLPVIESVPLWLTPNEKTRVYWSENHITMWLSSAWLIKEKYGIDKDPELRKKLVHCLDLKINYGYYEFFSSVYFPYTLSGLLNLVDFAEDPEIKQKAILATNRLLKEVLMVVNDKGGFFPAAGRNYRDKYNSAYGQNHSHLIYLLTGMGEKPANSSHAAAFLATSTLDVKEIVESWSAEENRVLNIGHPISELGNIHKDLLPNDKVVFQWSGGGYFHPDVALETATLLDSYNMWEHKEFKPFKDFKGLPVQLAPVIANAASSLSYSSVYLKADVAIYKNYSSTLVSAQNYWKGRAGFQQWPWAASTGTIGVTTQSGNINNALGEEDLSANSNLPYIEQKENVALIMYRPKKDLKLFGYDHHDVRLFWEVAGNKYDEVVFENKWIIGREGDSYVAVLRHCTDFINGEYGCQDQDGQLWACVVGNKEKHGSFDQFLQVIRSAKYQEKWNYVFNKAEWHYYGMIEVDGKKIEHDWAEGFTEKPDDPETDPMVTSVRNLLESNSVSVYPNPVKDNFILSWNMKVPANNSRLRIVDVSGREISNQKVDLLPGQSMQISVQGWKAGMYQVLLNTDIGAVVQKIIIQ